VKKSQAPLSKPVLLRHLGEGLLVFQIPLYSGPLQIDPESEKIKRPSGQRKMPAGIGIYLLLLKVSNYLKGTKGAFYIQLLQEGFLRKGAITLMGFLLEPPTKTSALEEAQPVFKTVIQVDGDIIYQLDRRLLSDSKARLHLSGYHAVQARLLEDFRQAMSSIVSGALALFSLSVTLLFLIHLISK